MIMTMKKIISPDSKLFILYEEEDNKQVFNIQKKKTFRKKGC